MEERVQISILVDFYGDLLTEKQKDIMDLYYNDDLSLSEIAEINHTSRQAIHDIIKRCNKILLEYENKLHIAGNSLNQEIKRELILSKLDLIYNLMKVEKENAKILTLINDIRVVLKESV